MKKIFLIVLIGCFTLGAYAQAGTDSAAYQIQRKKINAMLAARKQKFGEYDKSLTQHTGIFGLQTKNDIRHSNDILMDIVKTDDDIFVQLKILLDYSNFQQKEVQSHSVQADSSNLNFMATINKLRADNERLKQEADVTLQEDQKHSQLVFGIVIALIVIVLLLLRDKYIKKSFRRS